jgi:hypothetical protein
MPLVSSAVPNEATLATDGRMLDVGMAKGAGRRGEVDAAPLALQIISIIPDEALTDGDLAERDCMGDCSGILGGHSKGLGNDGEGRQERGAERHLWVFEIGSVEVVVVLCEYWQLFESSSALLSLAGV